MHFWRLITDFMEANSIIDQSGRFFEFLCLYFCYLNRDAYGFSVRPQHLQRYREYANIYKVISLFQYFSYAKFPSV